MIVRQEDYEKLKSDKKKGRQREIKNKINEECAFIPNGKKNVSSRNPNEFFNDQKKFIEKKEEIIHKMTKDILDKESKIANTEIVSKNSEKMASSKNPNETREEFCKRLAGEKLKSKKEVIEEPKEEKRLTKEEVKNLTLIISLKEIITKTLINSKTTKIKTLTTGKITIIPGITIIITIKIIIRTPTSSDGILKKSLKILENLIIIIQEEEVEIEIIIKMPER